MVLVDDPVSDGEAKANASLFCGEEGIKQFIHVPRRNTDARILNGELNPLMIIWHRCAQTQLAALRHGLDGIQQEVEHHLLHLLPVDRDRGQRSKAFLDRDSSSLDLGFKELKGFFKNGKDLCLFQERRRGFGESEKLIHNLIDPIDLFFDDLEIFPMGVLGWKAFPQRMDEDIDAGQRIADLMGDA